jgi:hypothetical protein
LPAFGEDGLFAGGGSGWAARDGAAIKTQQTMTRAMHTMPAPKLAAI